MFVYMYVYAYVYVYVYVGGNVCVLEVMCACWR